MSEKAFPIIQPPGPENVGERISLRLRLPDGGYQDIVGILESSSAIQKRTGEIVHFDATTVAAWRTIEKTEPLAGKGAPLSLRIREMEIAAARTWPAANQENLGDWVLRATGKFTMRANSVLVLGDPGCTTEKAIEEVVAFYAKHSLPPVFHIPLPTFEHLDTLLAEKGWLLKTRALVMIADIGNLVLSERENFEWTLTDTFNEAWLQLQNDFGVRDIMKSAPAVYAGLKIDGALVAVGRAANFENWTVLTRLFVHPDYRRQNIGTELLSRLLSAAQSRGATKAMLQVDDKNAPAIRAYEKYGFRMHHSYVYRILATQSNSEC